jgi:cytochrome c oxidase assembly protein subunit 15
LVSKKHRAVAVWLLTGVFMIIVQTLLGGVTRLTESGLSITEWKPITGALPPLTEQAWQTEFEKYKHIGQFHLLHANFTIQDFKFIFFWEWFHRLWARLLGVVFLVGFVWFFIKKYFDKEMIVPFVVLFLLGALQGLIGWIMVASGLNETSVFVNHIKLATHFVAAMGLLCYTLWFALKLLVPIEKRVASLSINRLTIVLIVLLGIQLFYGAFMSGLKAAPFAPTWPDINGSIIPSVLENSSWINDPISVQFIHRTLAYLLGIVLIFWFWNANKLAHQYPDSFLNKIKLLPIGLVTLQILLGIFTILHATQMGIQRFGTYELLAESHQLIAMFLLVSLMLNLYAVTRKTS